MGSMIDLLKERLHYNPLTGRAFWLKKDGCPGKMAGTRNIEGYLRIKFMNKNLLLHRVIWAITHGEWPSREIDHLNGDRSDNRIENLRCADRRTNSMNLHRHRSGRLWGAHKYKDKWQSRFRFEGSSPFFGYFKTERLAHMNSIQKLKELTSSSDRR